MNPAAAAALVAAGAAASWGARAAVGAFHPRSQWFGPVLSRGVLTGPDDRRIALTFDDGPHETATARILDLLAQRNVRAAFFVIGRYVDERPALVQRMIDEGHLVGNHTYDHDRHGLFWWEGYWCEQIERCSAAIEIATSAAGVSAAQPRLFRPPMGFKSRFNMHAAASAGLTTVTWTRRARDGFATTPQAIVNRLEAVRPGDIVLLHDGVEPAGRRTPEALVAALPAILDSLARRNLQPVRVDELLGLSARSPR